MNTTEAIKQEVKDIKKNYTRTPNILFESYPDLHPQEKWLFINLTYLCGAAGTRHLSLRYISERTGISIAALSGSKDPAKNYPGMIRHLHDAGLIHTEIRKQKSKNGKERGQEQYHITITDIWQLNEIFFMKCSEYEHSEEQDVESVQNMNESVHILNTNSLECSEYERECSEYATKIRLDSKITEDNKITEQEEKSVAGNTSPRAHLTVISCSQTQLQEDSSEETEEVSEKPKASSSKKKASSKKSGPIKQQIDNMYALFDTVYQKLMDDPNFHAPRTKKNTEAIEALIAAQAPDDSIGFVLTDIWHDKDKFWETHRTITAVASQYATRVFKMHMQSKPETNHQRAVSPNNGYSALLPIEKQERNKRLLRERVMAKQQAELLLQQSVN